MSTFHFIFFVLIFFLYTYILTVTWALAELSVCAASVTVADFPLKRSDALQLAVVTAGRKRARRTSLCFLVN